MIGMNRSVVTYVVSDDATKDHLVYIVGPYDDTLEYIWMSLAQSPTGIENLIVPRMCSGTYTLIPATSPVVIAQEDEESERRLVIISLRCTGRPCPCRCVCNGDVPPLSMSCKLYSLFSTRPLSRKSRSSLIRVCRHAEDINFQLKQIC
jgi:hypothetical protein